MLRSSDVQNLGETEVFFVISYVHPDLDKFLVERGWSRLDRNNTIIVYCVETQNVSSVVIKFYCGPK